MPDKVLITDFTWRTEAQQLATISAHKSSLVDATRYYDVEGRGFLVRPTTRREQVEVYVASLACLAEDEDDLIDFLRSAKKRGLRMVGIEENFAWTSTRSLVLTLKAFKAARNNGAAKVGARISADKKIADTKLAVEKIRDRWKLPSSEWSTADLLKEAGRSLNAVKAYLGSRIIAQRNYQAALKRKARAA
jgi:hypothetical protein